MVQWPLAVACPLVHRGVGLLAQLHSVPSSKAPGTMRPGMLLIKSKLVKKRKEKKRKEKVTHKFH
jgi:hypothetical protein